MLTDSEIDALLAGPKLDALVAAARGWKQIRSGASWYSSGQVVNRAAFSSWSPSTDIAAAKELMEDLQEDQRISFIKTTWRGDYTDAPWRCEIRYRDDTQAVISVATTEELAICRAYLKATREREDNG